MKIYDTLVIGSGYTSLGYAITRKNTVIVEEREMCDTEIGLSLKRYSRGKYEAKTELGKELTSRFVNLGIFDRGMQNAAALECGFADLAIAHGVEILLKCRVISASRTEDGIYDARIISGGGIEHIYSENILDLRGKSGEKFLTAVLESDGDNLSLKAAFPTAEIEPAFYPSRYALRLPLPENGDYDTARRELYRIFSESVRGAKLMCLAPILGTRADKSARPFSDRCFDDPIEALEAGVGLAKNVEFSEV